MYKKILLLIACMLLSGGVLAHGGGHGGGHHGGWHGHHGGWHGHHGGWNGHRAGWYGHRGWHGGYYRRGWGYNRVVVGGPRYYYGYRGAVCAPGYYGYPNCLYY